MFRRVYSRYFRESDGDPGCALTYCRAFRLRNTSVVDITQHCHTHTLLPTLARALQVSADALLGLKPVAKRNGRVPDKRMQRRLQQIASVPPGGAASDLAARRCLYERGQLKGRATRNERGAKQIAERTTARA